MKKKPPEAPVGPITCHCSLFVAHYIAAACPTGRCKPMPTRERNFARPAVDAEEVHARNSGLLRDGILGSGGRWVHAAPTLH